MANPNAHDSDITRQFTRQAEGYRRLVTASPSARAEALLARLRVAADDLVLDVACGPGSVALELAPHVRHATGADLTPAMLEQARLLQRERSLTNVSWELADARALPFRAGSFTLVVCSGAFHHMEEPRRVFAEMTRVCRSGGRVAVIDLAFAADKGAAYDAIEKQRDPSHVHALTEAELRALGAGQPVCAPALELHRTPHLPLESVLAVSYPEQVAVADIRAAFEADARSEEDRLGLDARIVDDEFRVSFPMATAVWVRL